MNNCSCGIYIGAFEIYCNRCKDNLSLRDKVIEGIRSDEIFGSQNIKKPLIEESFPCCEGECDCHMFLGGSGKVCPVCSHNTGKVKA